MSSTPSSPDRPEAAYVEATCNANCIGLVKLFLGWGETWTSMEPLVEKNLRLLEITKNMGGLVKHGKHKTTRIVMNRGH